MGATLRGLADLAPRTLALMHGPSFAGDGAAALRALADDYDRRVTGALAELLPPPDLASARPDAAGACSAPTSRTPLAPPPQPRHSPPERRSRGAGGRERHDPSRRLERVRPRAGERRSSATSIPTASTPPSPPALDEDKGINATTATLDQPEHGLPPTRLDETDVLLWWGHKAHGEVDDAIVERVAAARLGGHGPDRAPLRPLLEDLQAADGHALLACNGARPASASGSGSINRSHPIAAGLGECIELANEEMYGEPFAVPEPLETVFISWFEGGEVFRSGMTWQRGAGRIFYFRPGHETYPTYHDAECSSVLRNAVHWAYNPAAAWADVHEAPERAGRQGAGEDHVEKGPRLHAAGEEGLR